MRSPAACLDSGAVSQQRIPILFLAPWAHYGGTDKSMVDWFRWIDRDRFAPSLITTQPSENRWYREVEPYAEEIWTLPDLMPGGDFPRFILDFIQTRGIGLVHIMNSRLGYELIPDIATLPDPPRIVVQLHVEEPERNGYVRYVATRFGNLVDAFSVSMTTLVDSLQEYAIAPGRIHYIPTCVDAEREFAPGRHEPYPEVDRSVHQILFAARLVEQKDPLLMLEVADALRTRTPGFQIQVVGDGDLEGAIRDGITERGLTDHVVMNPPAQGLGRWYASCDSLLLTSLFEGIPVTVYDAMAMAMPIVGPRLGGLVELVGDNGGALIPDRADVAGYVDALAGLVEDAEHARGIAESNRSRMLTEFPIERMARDHERLYEALLADRSRPPTVSTYGRAVIDPVPAGQRPEPIALPARPNGGEDRKVSIVIPCYNHGHFLPACLESIQAQSYPDIEVIVVDNASSEAHTLEVLAALEEGPHLRLLRLTENHGPAPARNAAIEASTGRYVLPVDADNTLHPGAVAAMVEQLETAPPWVGFIYPNLDFFGDRHDYFKAPTYNLHVLMHKNYCDTCSLFDRGVFDAGIRFDEDMDLGYEDWDLFLRLGEVDVFGEPAGVPTVRFWKRGFSRCEVVELGESFEDKLPALHPWLYGAAPYALPAVRIKSQWAPALSIVALEPSKPQEEQGRRVIERSGRQTCLDFELLAVAEGQWFGEPSRPVAIDPRDHGVAGAADAPALALSIAKGRWVLVTEGTGSELLADPAIVEKLLRVVNGDPAPDGIVLCRLGDDDRPMVELDAASRETAIPHGVLWDRRALEDGEPLPVRPGQEVRSLVEHLRSTGLSLQWRMLPAPAEGPARDGGIYQVTTPPTGAPDDAINLSPDPPPPALPTMTAPPPRLRGLAEPWQPAAGITIYRHKDIASEQRIISNTPDPDLGYELEYVLGVARSLAPPGTARLVCEPDGTAFQLLDREDVEGAARKATLGFVETVGFILLDPLQSARHPGTGQEILLGGVDDPLHGVVEPLWPLGFIEPCPLRPRTPPVGAGADPVGLVRGWDPRRRRHVYAVGSETNGLVEGELGALASSPQTGAIPVWLTGDGRVVTESHFPAVPRPGLKTVGRWALGPIRWKSMGQPIRRATAIVARSLQAPWRLIRAPRPPRPPEGQPLGYLFATYDRSRRPLYSALHGVTGDQLLTTNPTEAVHMGYIRLSRLGFLAAEAPVTGSLELEPTRVPFASRFGLGGRG